MSYLGWASLPIPQFDCWGSNERLARTPRSPLPYPQWAGGQAGINLRRGLTVMFLRNERNGGSNHPSGGRNYQQGHIMPRLGQIASRISIVPYFGRPGFTVKM